MKRHPTTDGTRRQKRSIVSKYWSHGLAFLLGCCLTSFSMMAFLHHGDLGSPTFAQQYLHQQKREPIYLADQQSQELHKVAGLDCAAHGGPSRELAQEMVYWKDLPEDSGYVAPFHDKNQRRYLTFEPDGGGWNNIRMSMETVLTIAVATGRVLVLPPSQHMYRKSANSLIVRKGMNCILTSKGLCFLHWDTSLAFSAWENIAEEHPGLEVITTKQFLEQTYGKVHDKETNEITYPPLNRTDWDGDTSGTNTQLGPWLRKIAYNADWNPDDCVAAFPKSTSIEDEQLITTIFDELKGENINIEHFVNQPTPVNGTTKDRMAEFIAKRSKLCLYDHKIQQEPILHFAGKRNLAGGRLLVHFYAFLFFQDWKEDLWMKRFVRDHVRYTDEIQCAAARIVAAVREDARRHDRDNPNGYFDSFHIRRGDFQYKKTRVDAKDILEVSKDEIPKGTTVYVATDEHKKEFFHDMESYWNVVYMDNYLHLLDGVDKNYFGMIDQLVSSRGRLFFGCWFSTFTGYITRLRGYHSQNVHREGYELGLLPDTYYYAVAIHKTKMHDFWPIKKLFYAREYPASWRNIDFNAPELS
eukprot:scaffold17468_cov106-Cylindrotheca_fusiformis.AAC.4